MSELMMFFMLSVAKAVLSKNVVNSLISMEVAFVCIFIVFLYFMISAFYTPMGVTMFMVITIMESVLGLTIFMKLSTKGGSEVSKSMSCSLF
uniref:NADH-ubiquinone oxidoreductase chain 4L n=1 Tax=Microthoracius praelongiceps TaxID=1958934 RepID=A0A1S5XVS9_9NEOP|nr:NADH dehydrogenase subunit 4L [Microthoracius praelongiceps]